jgi:hypothetical protein
MSETRTPYALRPEELLQKQEDAEDVSSRQFWVDTRAALLMQVRAIEKRLGMEEKACPHCGGRKRG